MSGEHPELVSFERIVFSFGWTDAVDRAEAEGAER